MYKRVFVLPAVLALLLLLLGNAPVASAHPASVNCSTTCKSYTYWNGTNYGGNVSTIASNPGFYNNCAFWARFMRVGSGSPRIEIGEEKLNLLGLGCTPQYLEGVVCNNEVSGNYYFIYSWNSSGQVVDNYCYPWNSGDENNTLGLTLQNQAGCGSGPMAIINPWVHATITHCTNVGKSFNRIENDEQINDQVTGHQVWGVDWTSSAYYDSNANLHFQARAADGTGANNPPQEYWHTVPASGNNGGDLYTCDYDSGTTCTIGG